MNGLNSSSSGKFSLSFYIILWHLKQTFHYLYNFNNFGLQIVNNEIFAD